MSQEKVDKYKAEKANRKKNIAKEKRKKKLYIALGILLGVVFVGWIGVSVYLEIKQDREDESLAAEYSKLIEEYYATSTDATSGNDGATTSGSESETTSGEASSDETTSSGETTSGDETTSQNETTSEEETTSQEETTTTATE